MTIPKIEKILQFRQSFLKMLTKVARDTHVKLIVGTARGPKGVRFRKLSGRYAKEKLDKYGLDSPNLSASGLMFDQFKPKKPKNIGGTFGNIKLSYGISGGAVHPRNKGSVSTSQLMTYHQEGTDTMPARDIAGEKVLHNETRDKVVRLLVNQINRNIRDALHPGKTTENL